MRAAKALLVMILAAAALLFVPGRAEAQVTCGAVTTKTTFPGGFIVQRTCNGYQVNGVGSTLALAQTNLTGFKNLAPTRYCSGSSTPLNAIPGGFTATWECLQPAGFMKYVGGFGSTATDTGVNTLQLGTLLAASGFGCRINHTDVTAYVGGYKANAYCSTPTGGVPIVSGVGSTATATGTNVYGFAELAAAGNTCFMSGPMERSGVLYKAVFYCTKGLAIGYGSSATDAGLDALDLAQSM